MEDFVLFLISVLSSIGLSVILFFIIVLIYTSIVRRK